MPAGFDHCRRNGGKIRTVKTGKNKYRHVCFLGGRAYEGYVKTKKKEEKK